MLRVFKGLVHRYFSDEEAVILALVLVIGFTVILTMGAMLAPVIASMVLAFVLQGIVSLLERRGVPHILAVISVFVFFLALLVLVILGLIPLLWEQLTTLFQELPRMMQEGQQLLLHLPEAYPGFISEEQIVIWMNTLQGQLGQLGQWVLSVSIAQLPNFVGVLIYLILVPILVFFFLKDRALLHRWVRGLLPENRSMMRQVGEEMNQQIANYIRGKVIEILIVGVATFIALQMMGLNYAALLGLLVGLSVVVPYVGAAVVTIPVALIGLFQWGWGQEFWVLMLVYAIIQALDGNVLVPLLFSEAVNLHPIAIIVAVLVFGGLWGFWGIFFAIPLATLLKAVMNAWPTQDRRQQESDAPPSAE